MHDMTLIRVASPAVAWQLLAELVYIDNRLMSLLWPEFLSRRSRALGVELYRVQDALLLRILSEIEKQYPESIPPILRYYKSSERPKHKQEVLNRLEESDMSDSNQAQGKDVGLGLTSEQDALKVLEMLSYVEMWLADLKSNESGIAFESKKDLEHFHAVLDKASGMLQQNIREPLLKDHPALSLK